METSSFLFFFMIISFEEIILHLVRQIPNNIMETWKKKHAINNIFWETQQLSFYLLMFNTKGGGG